MGLYQKFRPTKLEDVVGQDQAVAAIRAYLEKGTFPPTTLFYGPSGVGKDTLARIVCKSVGCPKGPDRTIVNAADERGVETIRSIRDRMSTYPMMGKYKVWIFSECQQWTSTAQSALLEMFEDTPSHILFMMTTTDPQKLQKAILTRSFQVKLRSLNEDELFQVLKTVCKKAELNEKDDILKEIANKSDGSARMAIQTLDDIKGLVSDEAKLKIIMSHDVRGISNNIAFSLIYDYSPKWVDVANQLRGKTNDEAEGIRQQIMAIASTVLINQGVAKSIIESGKKVHPNEKRMERAHRILEIFESLSPYDGGLHRLVRFCYEACNS